MLSQPAFLMSHYRSDAKGKTFFTQQRITTITTSIRHDQTLFGEMRDVFYCWVTGPATVLLTGFQWSTNAVYAFYISFFINMREYGIAHTCHDAHVHHHVFRIGDLYTITGKGGTHGTHTEGDHIQCTSFHGSFRKPFKGVFHFTWLHPVIGWTRIFFSSATDIRTVFNQCYITWITETGKAVRSLFRIQTDEGSFVY